MKAEDPNAASIEYRSETLFFKIISSHFCQITIEQKIELHKNTLPSIIEFITEYGEENEKAFFDYALWRIIQEYIILTQK